MGHLGVAAGEAAARMGVAMEQEARMQRKDEAHFGLVFGP